jgi:hypothetical protein
VIGLPLGATVFAVFLVLVYLSKIVVGLVVGGILLRRRGPQPFGRAFTALAVGLVLLYFLTAPPILGVVVWFVVVVAGMGGLVLALSRSQRFFPEAGTPGPTPPAIPVSTEDRGGSPRE